MEQENNPSTPAEELRKRAESELVGKEYPPEEMSPERMREIIHELRVHRVELEMQNEALRATSRELEESRERFADLYDFAPVGYVTLDSQGLILEANLTAARELGVERDSIIGRPLWSYIVREDRSVLYHHLHDVFKTESRVTSEVRLEREAGPNLWVRLESVSASDPHGNRSCRTSLINMTDRKRAEEALQNALVQLQDHARRLEETNKELEGFAYTISHDLRAPLRAINGFAHMLADDYEPSLDEEGKQWLAVIEANAIKMGLLIDDLIAFSRAGRKAMNVTRIDMSRLTADVVERLKPSDGPKAVIHVAALPAAQGDPALIRQVLANLLENAVKFSRNSPEPRIVVGSFERDGEQVYFVKDNGVGFDMKYHDKLFGVFHRLVTEKEFEGTGVGLAIVHRLISRHGGRVWAEGRPGEGATFFFTLKQNEREQA